jgi:hypothetical protein
MQAVKRLRKVYEVAEKDLFRAYSRALATKVPKPQPPPASSIFNGENGGGWHPVLLLS